jgi:hypothetical protein
MGFLHFGQIGGGAFLGISGTHAKSGASITGLTVTDYCRDWGGDVLNLPVGRLVCPAPDISLLAHRLITSGCKL